MDKSIFKLNEILFSVLEDLTDDEKLDKLEEILVEVLNCDKRKLDEHQINKVKVTSKSVNKSNKEIAPGEIFQIYLKDMDCYAYGVVVDGDLTKDRDADILIAYLNHYAKSESTVEEIYKHIDNRNFAFVANSSIYSILKRIWKPVSLYKKPIFSADAISNIPYVTLFGDSFYRTVGNPTTPIYDCETVSEQEAKLIPNPSGIVGDIELEEMLLNHAMKKFHNR